MVIQYSSWKSLRHYLIKNRKIEKDQIATILTEILKTVSYMHKAGVCHRDLKPDNILYDPIKRKIKVIDFDLARIRKYSNKPLEMMTKTGTISYRAPQTFSSIYNQKVDIWSVGVIAYELLTNNIPFYSDYQSDQIRKICKMELDYSQFSLWEQDILSKLLNKNPDNRINSSDALSLPFLLMNSKFSENASSSKSLTKSPSVDELSEKSMKNEQLINRFYDEDLANMFLGNNQGDIGVVRCVSS